MGLTSAGFIPESITDIKDRIEARLEQFNTGFDFSPESPDGQLIGIMAAELSLAWDELNKVYRSYDPNTATGQALRNLAQITGITYQAATRSSAVINLTGTANTLVPEGSIVSNDAGDKFYTNADAIIPNDVTVVAVITGITPVDVATNPITIISTAVTGWDNLTQAADGIEGTDAQEEGQYRNLRNRTVMRNNKNTSETLIAKLYELGIPQVLLVNNDTVATTNGVPPRAVSITIGEVGLVTDQQIAEEIFKYKGIGVYTYGTTAVPVLDSQNNTHTINFTKSTPLPIYINLDVTYLSSESAGATEYIKQALSDHINSLLVGEDIVWSRLFSFVTPYGKAQVNNLSISNDNITFVTTNIPISDTKYPSCSALNINLTIT